MGCASSLQRVAPRLHRDGTRNAAQQAPAQDTINTRTSDAELSGAVPERGDAATSSRLRAGSSSRDLAPQQQQQTSASERTPLITDLPSVVPEEQAAAGSVGAQQGPVLHGVSAPGQPGQGVGAGEPSPAITPQQQEEKVLEADPQQPTVPATADPEPQSQPPPQAAAAASAVAAFPTQIGGVELAKLLAQVQISAAPAPPPSVADGRKLVLLAWDIEHVRCPQGDSGSKASWKHPLSPQNVLGYLKQHFVYSCGRMEYRSMAALSDACLRNILRFHEQFVELVVPNLSLLLAANGTTGAVLEKEVRAFMAEHAHIARQSPGQLTIALVARDDHFTEIRQEASEAGFCVEGLSQRQWVDFLRLQSGQQTVKLVKP